MRHARRTGSTQSTLVLSLALAALALAAYAGVAGNGFIEWEDSQYLTGNVVVRGGLGWRGILWALTEHAPYWHPLTWLSHLLDVELFGMHPGPHHLVSLLIHVANVLLLFQVLRRLTGSALRSAAVAALFAVHPLHVESVAWAAERKDLLCMFFLLLATAGYLRFLRLPSAPRYFAVAVAFAAALMSKPYAVTFPLLLLLLDAWPLGRLTGDGPPLRRLLGLVREKIPLLALAAAASALTFVNTIGVGAVGSLATYPLGHRLVNAAVGYWRYIGKTLWPRNLAVYYPHPATGAWPWLPALAALAGLLVVSFAALRLSRSRGWPATGWFWFLGALVPMSGIVQVGSQSIADRFTYIPLVGLYLLVVWGFSELSARAPRLRAALCAGLLGVLLLLVVAARFQVSLWRDERDLFRHALSVTGENPVADTNLGFALYRAGDLQEAAAHYEAALRLNPTVATTHLFYGMLLADSGDLEGAERQMREAVALDPADISAWNNLGIVSARLGNLDEGVAHFEEALRLDPRYALAAFNLGLTLERQGRLAGARESYLRALALDPTSAEAHNNLGLILAGEGRTAEAMAHFREALRLAPEMRQARENIERLRTGGAPR